MTAGGWLVLDDFSGHGVDLWSADLEPPPAQPVRKSAEEYTRQREQTAAPKAAIPPIEFAPNGAPVPTDDVIAALFLLMRGARGVTDGEAWDGGDSDGQWKLPGVDGSKRHYRLKNLRSRLTKLRHICVWRNESRDENGLWRDEAKDPWYILHVPDSSPFSDKKKPFLRHYLSPLGAKTLMNWVLSQPGVGEQG